MPQPSQASVKNEFCDLRTAFSRSAHSNERVSLSGIKTRTGSIRPGVDLQRPVKVRQNLSYILRQLHSFLRHISEAAMPLAADESDDGLDGF